MAVHTSVLVAVCACLVVAVVGNLVHDLEEKIKELNEEEKVILIGNRLLQIEYVNLTTEYDKYIQDLYRQRGVLKEDIDVILGKLLDERAEMFGLRVKKYVLQGDLDNLKEDEEELELVVRVVTRELKGYREGRKMGDGELCRKYHPIKKTEVLSNKLVGAILIKIPTDRNDTDLIKILEAKVVKAQEAVWDAEDETRILVERIKDLKALYERESEEVTAQLSRLANNKKDLEKTSRDFDIELQGLKKETQELKDQVEERAKKIDNIWIKITILHEEYVSYKEDISCYAWLRDWAFHQLPHL